MTYRQLAAELGVSGRTIEAWYLDAVSTEHRAMPLKAIRHILKLLDDRKRELMARGDRLSAEVIDALGAQVDPARLVASLRTFDALQRSSPRIAPMDMARRKPRFFTTFAQKNAWEREEERRLAIRVIAQTPGKR